MAVRKRRTEDGAPAEARDNVVEAPIPRRLSVSETLRGRRLECGVEIDHVATVLRIRAAVLDAIENGRFDQLPGPAYAIGFVRSYATYLGLDAEALVHRFKAEAADVSRKPHLHFPLPVNESRVPTGAILLIAALLAILLYAGWYYFSVRPSQFSSLVPAVPDRLSHLLSPDQLKKDVAAPAEPTAAPAAAAQGQTLPVPASTAPATPQPLAAAPTPAPAVSAAPSAAAPTAEADGVPPVDRPGVPVAAATVPAAPDLVQPAVNDSGKGAQQAATYGGTSADARIVLHATADSWIEIRDSHDNLLFTRVLKPGETYNVPKQAGLTMVTGNAGGLDITVDGAALKSIGDAGQVVRNIALDPDRLLASHPRAN